MTGKAGRPGYDALAAPVADLREQVRQLKAEHARLRAELVARRPGDTDDTSPEPATAEPMPGKRRSPLRWAKANVVRVARRRPRKRRAPVPGWRRAHPDRQIVHALAQ